MFSVRCKQCRASHDFSPSVKKCPHCGAPVPEALRGTSPSRSKSDAFGDKARQRRAAEAAFKRAGEVQSVSSTSSAPTKARRRKEGEHGLHGTLEFNGGLCRLHQQSRTIRVVVVGSPNAASLDGYSGHWIQAGRTPGGLLQVKPAECREVQRLRLVEDLAAKTLATRSRLGPTMERYGPSPPGTSELERIADPREQILRIQVLAVKRDDPAAWATLANGYRIKRLRPPLEGAMRNVGWAKIASLVTARPHGWPDGLLEWLAEEQRADASRRAKGARTQQAYQRDEYGTLPD